MLTIGKLVEHLETEYEPDDEINITNQMIQHLTAQQRNGGYEYRGDARKTDEWDAINFRTGTAKVSQMLVCLKEYLPEHKDKFISTYVDKIRDFGFPMNKIKSVKTCTLDFSRTIKDLPRVKAMNAGKNWEKFQGEIKKFVDLAGSEASLLQAIQVLLMQNADVESVYFVDNGEIYNTYLDVLKAYPELTPEDEKDLFTIRTGVHACTKTRSGLVELCESRKSVKYFVENSEGHGKYLTKEELLKQYSMPESIIDKLFYRIGNVMSCKSNQVMEAFKV